MINQRGVTLVFTASCYCYSMLSISFVLKCTLNTCFYLSETLQDEIIKPHI